MAIDKSGEWWVGDSLGDLEEYLREFQAGGYAVHRYKAAICACGENAFSVEVDDDEEGAKRVCRRCGKVSFVGDSEEYFSNSTRSFRCIECKADSCNVGVGFSRYEVDGIDVRWLSVGVRCVSCGILGCLIDWKVGGGNEPDFLERV